MIKATFTLSLALFCAGLGNIMLSKGMHSLGPLEHYQLAFLSHYFAHAITNFWVLSGILMELVYFLLWLVVLSLADVSWALPMNAVEYIFVAVLAQSLLGEKLHFTRWIGVILISAGIVFMMKSWKKEKV